MLGRPIIRTGPQRQEYFTGFERGIGNDKPKIRSKRLLQIILPNLLHKLHERFGEQSIPAKQRSSCLLFQYLLLMGLRIFRVDLVGLVGGDGKRFEVCELRRDLVVGEVSEPIDSDVFRDKDVDETIGHRV